MQWCLDAVLKAKKSSLNIIHESAHRSSRILLRDGGFAEIAKSCEVTDVSIRYFMSNVEDEFGKVTLTG